MDLVELSRTLSEAGNAQGVPVLVLAALLLASSYVSTYRQRRRKERRLTGRESSIKDMEHLKLPRRTRAHETNPAVPAVRLRREPAPYKTVSSTKRLWWVAGRDYDEPYVVAVGMTGAGKNQALLDPTAWNIVEHREESAVIVDIKGDMISEFAYRTRAPQFAYSFLETHARSSAINLIADPKMAATTAAALYPVQGVRFPIFNQGARDLFEALAEALAYSNSNIVELHHYLKNLSLMHRLGRRNKRLNDAITGENRKFIGDVITSARLPLSPLNRPEVARVSAPDPSTPQPRFLRKEVIWLCIPQDDPGIALLAGAIADNLYNRATASRRGTYFPIDEARSCLTTENLAKYLYIGRGLGACFFLVLQDISQLQARIGIAETRSVLGNAGVQFWGKTQDTETARYVSDLSGTVRVRLAVYEDDGGERAWKQMFSAKGAPYKMEERNRAGILPEHVHSLPKNWWYAYEGDPHGIELLIPALMHQWIDRALPALAPVEILGIPEAPPATTRDFSLPEDPAPEPAHDQGDSVVAEEIEVDAENRASSGGRKCPGCERPATSSARFCESCGARL
jgi:hypothetical protein